MASRKLQWAGKRIEVSWRVLRYKQIGNKNNTLKSNTICVRRSDASFLLYTSQRNLKIQEKVKNNNAALHSFIQYLISAIISQKKSTDYEESQRLFNHAGV